MLRHPSASSSLLKCKTLFTSDSDVENVNANFEPIWKNHPYVSYIKRFNELLGLSSDKLLSMTSTFKPIELHIQSLSELLYNQRSHYKNPYKFKRSNPTSSEYIKSFGLNLALELESLFDESNTSFRDDEIPSNLYTILPARAIECNYALDSRFNNLVDKSFKLLSAYWMKFGYGNDDHRIKQSSPNTIAKWNFGKDIGVKSVPYLLLSKYNFLCEFMRSKGPFIQLNKDTVQTNRIISTRSLDIIRKNLDKYGVAVVRNVFNRDQIRYIRGLMLMSSSMARDTAFKMLEHDPNVTTLKYTRGRINCLLNGTKFSDSLAPLQSFWLPIIYYNMNEDRRIYLSNLQFVISGMSRKSIVNELDSVCYNEPWHRNNKNFGLVVVVPLDDINSHNGRLQFIPGSHKLQSNGIMNPKGPVGVDLKAGDVLIYNGSILHRNTFNDSIKCQSMITFAYDYTDTPPPGQGLIKCTLDRLYGNLIVQVNGLLRYE